MISKERLLHLCFDEEDFRHEAFVPAKFLVQKRRHVSLETLQKDLRLYLEHLKEEVVQLINTDLYDNFLCVSKKLAGMDGELARICEPLPEMVHKVDKAKRKLEDSRSIVQQKLAECKGIDQTRQFIVMVLKLTIMADKVEDWLEAYSEGTQGLSQFHRIAVECQQLRADEALLLATTADQQEERQTLLSRTARLRLRFEELLDDCFVHVLRMQQELLLAAGADPLELAALEEQARVYLECYHVLQKEDAVANLFQTHVCKEVVEKVLSWTTTGNNRGAAPEALQLLFQELLQEIRRRCVPLVRVSQAVLGRFCLTRAIWKCAVEVIVKRMQHIFSPGIPNKFHAHYSAAHQLLVGLEAIIADPVELQEFRHSEEMEGWNGKWLLSVYTALRQKELMAGLTTLLQQHLQPVPLDDVAGTGFHFEQVLGLHRLTVWLWGDQVWLYPIGEQLMRMTVKALVALERWLAQFWVAPPPAPPAPMPQVLEEEGSPVATQPAEPPGEKKATGLLAGEMHLKDHVALHCDLTRLQVALETDLQHIILQRMSCAANGNSTHPLEAAVAALCAHCGAIVRRPLSVVQGMVVRAVAKECVDTLVPPLKSITSLYRMTKKPVPKRFSFFIPTVLNGLQSFKEACTATATAPPKYALSAAVLAECVQAVLAEVTTTYYTEAKALLITARKAEKAVSTLRKKQKKADEDRPAELGEVKEEMSDTDKIFVQIHLDIREYGHQAQTLFGMAPDFGPYQQLCGLVRRAAWLLGELPEEPPDALDC